MEKLEKIFLIKLKKRERNCKQLNKNENNNISN